MEISQIQYVIDTFFLLFASVLIILMVPGFAMLEAGLVRGKNVSAVLTGNVLLYAITSFIFLLWISRMQCLEEVVFSFRVLV